MFGYSIYFNSIVSWVLRDPDNAAAGSGRQSGPTSPLAMLSYAQLYHMKPATFLG